MSTATPKPKSKLYVQTKSFFQFVRSTRPLAKRYCPVCEYRGWFTAYGKPTRIDARCPNCRSLERHRLLWSWYKSKKITFDQPILHFAAQSGGEKVFQKQWRKEYQNYKTADLFKNADVVVNIEQIDLPDESVGTVICNHVLEHVNDKKAIAEVHRILKPDGLFIVSVPLIEGWSSTCENEDIVTKDEKVLHFGQGDHLRFYGRDFRDRLQSGGFNNISEITAEGAAVIEMGLSRGEKIFICRKK